MHYSYKNVALHKALLSTFQGLCSSDKRIDMGPISKAAGH